jgi:hypothetical protein
VFRQTALQDRHGPLTKFRLLHLRNQNIIRSSPWDNGQHRLPNDSISKCDVRTPEEYPGVERQCYDDLDIMLHATANFPDLGPPLSQMISISSGYLSISFRIPTIQRRI